MKTNELNRHGKPKRFHYVPGLTETEYKEIKACLRNPAAQWPWLSYSEFLHLARHMLFYRGAYRKAIRFARLLTRTVPRTGIGVRGMSAISRALVQFESRNLALMRDTPPKGAKTWYKNKARYVKWMDDVVMDVIVSSVYPLPIGLGAMISRTVNFWASKRLPGVDRKLKRGPRKAPAT